MSSTPSAQNQAMETALRNAVTKPASVSGDAGSMSSRQLSDAIEGDAYIRANSAVRNRKTRGIRISRVENGGAA